MCSHYFYGKKMRGFFGIKMNTTYITHTINHTIYTVFYIFSPSRNSSRTNSLAVLKRQLAAACAKQSPQLRIFAPVADNDPPYKSSAVVKSMSSSPDLANALPGVYVSIEMK